VTVEPAVSAPGGWSVAVGRGFEPGERLKWSQTAEDGTLPAAWDSDDLDLMLPDSRGGFGFGLGSPGQDAVGHTINATVTGASCTAHVSWQIAAENEQTRDLPATDPEPCSPVRATSDRVDDSDEHQVHVMYAVPDDAVDRELDTSGQIAAAFEHIDAYLREKLDGHGLRLDTCDGELDVTFLPMPRGSAEYAAMRHGFSGGLELDLARLGFRNGKKLYVVVWDGFAQWARLFDGCGGEAGYHGVAAIFTRSTLGEPCAELGKELPIGEPDTGATHEILHLLGLPAQCGANVDEIGHVTDETADLMYGIGHTDATEIDASHDDYYLHDDPECPDLADSAFLDPLPDDPQLPVDWPAD